MKFLTFGFIMGRLNFACFPPFLPKKMPSSFTNIDEALGLFCSATADPRKLESSLSKGTISLGWCCEAINFLKIMHSNFYLLIEKSEIPKSWKGVSCLDLYMEETLSLLDFCNWLKTAIFGMDRYRLIVEFAAKMLCDHELPDARIKFEVESLERESRKLYGVERWKDINFFKISIPKIKARDLNIHVVYVVKAIMSVIYKLIFSVIFYPISVKLDHQVFDQIPQLKSTSTSLLKLVSVLSKRLHEIKDDSKPVLVENKMIERVVMDIKSEILKGDAMDKGKQQKSIDLLRSSSMALRDGLQLFESAVNEIFEEVIVDRNKLLALFKTN